LLVVWVGIVASLAAGLGLARSAGRSHDRGGALSRLTPAERKALDIVSVRAAGEQPTGLVVTVTFAGNIQQLIGRGHLKDAAVAMILKPKTAGLAAAGLLTSGPGAVGTTYRKTRSQQVGVSRQGRRLVFFIKGPGVSNVGALIVKSFVKRPSVHRRSLAAAGSEGAPLSLTTIDLTILESHIGWSQARIADLAAKVESAPCDQLQNMKQFAQKILSSGLETDRALSKLETSLNLEIHSLEHGVLKEGTVNQVWNKVAVSSTRTSGSVRRPPTPARS
jgi:hypothetical protein